MFRNISCFMLLVMTLTLMSCGPKFMPVAVTGAVVDDKAGSITIEKEGVSVTASVGLMGKTPYDIERYFTPFEIEVGNNTGSEVAIEYDDFILIDGKGRQHRPYPPEKISEIIRSDPDYVVAPPAVAITAPTIENYSGVLVSSASNCSSFTGYPCYDSLQGRWLYDNQSRNMPGETLMQDIYLTSLPTGKIVDGAKVSGDIYFRTDLTGLTNVKLRATVNGQIFELPFHVK